MKIYLVKINFHEHFLNVYGSIYYFFTVFIANLFGGKKNSKNNYLVQ